MLMTWEVAELVRQKMGLKLHHTQYTTGILVDEKPHLGYVCSLYGPYFHVPGNAVPDRDSRIWVTHRLLDGSAELQLLVQDATDDAFLNSNAAGAEQFNTSPVRL